MTRADSRNTMCNKSVPPGVSPPSTWYIRAAVPPGCGVDPQRLYPDGEVTRAQMAVFVVKAFGLVLYEPWRRMSPRMITQEILAAHRSRPNSRRRR